MPKVSINLVTYNGEKYISPCLASVMAQKFRNFSILLINNGSTDGTRGEIEKWEKILQENGIDVKVVYNEKNLGFAEGHNQGFKFQISNFKFQKNAQNLNFKFQKKSKDQILNIQKGDGINPPLSPFAKGGDIEYVCCLNQDIILTPNYLADIVEFMDAHSECGSASGKLLSVSDELFKNTSDSSAHSPTSLEFGLFGRNDNKKIGEINYELLKKECKIIDSAGLKIFKSQRVVEKGQGEKDNGQYDKINESFGVSGAAPIYRVDALEDIKSSKLKVQSSKLGREQKNYSDSFPAIRTGQDFEGRSVNTHPLPLSRGEQYEYFDSDFFSYKEDVDLAYRMRWRGWKSFVIPDAIAFHKRTAKDSTGKKSDFSAAFNRRNKSKFANYYSQRNQIFLLMKNLDSLNLDVIWYEGKKFIYELFFEWSTFKAWIDAFKKIGVMKVKRRWIIENRKVDSGEIGKWYEK